MKRSYPLLFTLLLLCSLLPTGLLAQEIVLEGNITNDLTLEADKDYLLRGYVYVKNGATLSIEPGTVVRGERATKATLIITREGSINAQGTPENPIVFTSNQPDGSRSVGDWGGIVVLGSAPANCIGDCPIEGGLNNSEGDGLYGGNDPDDNSGVLSYIRIDWAGIAIQPDNEINALTLGGVGRGTQIDHIQISFSGDDAIEFFGGTANASHIVTLGTIDDSYDTDFGWSGNVQFSLAVRYPNRYDISLSNGFESDNQKNGFLSTPFTQGSFSNMTIIGPGIYGQAVDSRFQAGVNFRRSTQLKVFNSVFIGWPKGVFLEGQNCEQFAQQDSLRFAHNAIVACTESHDIELNGATPSLDFNQWFNNNQNEVYATTNDVGFDPAFTPVAPNFLLNAGSPVLSGANFSDAALQNPFFQQVNYRGAFNQLDWTACWTNWDPQNTHPENPVPCTNSISEQAPQNPSANLFPNPTQGNIRLAFKSATRTPCHVQLYSPQGKLVYQTTYTPQRPGAQILELGIENLPKGVYICSFTQKNLHKTFKVVKLQ